MKGSANVSFLQGCWVPLGWVGWVGVGGVCLFGMGGQNALLKSNLVPARFAVVADPPPLALDVHLVLLSKRTKKGRPTRGSTSLRGSPLRSVRSISACCPHLERLALHRLDLNIDGEDRPGTAHWAQHGHSTGTERAQHSMFGDQHHRRLHRLVPSSRALLIQTAFWFGVLVV